MREFAMPLVNYLQSIGVNAEFSGRNDIQIDGLKISGNAQAYSNNIMLHHGSILFDADLTHATNALTPKKEKLDAKGVKSVRSRMTLIRRHLLNDMTPNEFFNGFFDYVCDTHDNMVETPLTDDEISQINEIQTSKWNTWEWNYGKNPKANFNKTKKFKGGLVEVNAVISKGRIEEINIFGDFFGKKDKDELEQLIVGNKHDEESLRAILTTSDINQYLSNITMDELMEVLF
jgi:lipoate-protein ligase A